MTEKYDGQKTEGSRTLREGGDEEAGSGGTSICFASAKNSTSHVRELGKSACVHSPAQGVEDGNTQEPTGQPEQTK